MLSACCPKFYTHIMVWYSCRRLVMRCKDIYHSNILGSALFFLRNHWWAWRECCKYTTENCVPKSWPLIQLQSSLICLAVTHASLFGQHLQGFLTKRLPNHIVICILNCLCASYAAEAWSRLLLASVCISSVLMWQSIRKAGGREGEAPHRWSTSSSFPEFLNLTSAAVTAWGHSFCLFVLFCFVLWCLC